MTENKERMKKGLIYDPTDPELMREQGAYISRVNEYNATSPAETEKRAALIKEMFAEAGEGCYIEPPFRANWGGKHVRLGNYVYANFNLTLVDDGNIEIGDNVMFAPNVTVITATHPVLPALREKGMQFNADVKICNNAWIGAGAIIMPGITGRRELRRRRGKRRDQRRAAEYGSRRKSRARTARNRRPRPHILFQG